MEGNNAVGVELTDRYGKRYLAEKEVILSTGAVGSPQILMFSRNTCQTWRYKTGHHLPEVGRNLQDHMNIGLNLDVMDRLD